MIAIQVLRVVRKAPNLLVCCLQYVESVILRKIIEVISSLNYYSKRFYNIIQNFDLEKRVKMSSLKVICYNCAVQIS